MVKKPFLFSLFVYCLFSPSISSAGEAQDAILRGNNYVQNREYENAVKEYKEALRVDPQNQKASLLLGLTYANTGDLDEAIKYTQKAVEGEPSYTGFHNLGLIYANKRDYDKAVDAYKEALKLNDTSFRAWYQLGLVYASDLKFKEAVQAYHRAIEVHPRFTDAYLGLGSAYYWSGNKEEALNQVKILEDLKAMDKSQALENWIKNKEAKKEEAKKKREKRDARRISEEI